MRFSKTLTERHHQVTDLIEKCEVSLGEREDKYRKVRRFVLYGTDDGRQARYNKIYHSLRLKSSFLYSSRTVRFTITLPYGASTDLAEHAEEASAHLTQLWRKSQAGRLFSQQVFWSLAYGSMATKYGWNGGPRCWLVEPGNLGVLREENPLLENQEAVSMRFYTSRAEVRRALLADGTRTEESVDNQLKRLPTVEGMPSKDNFVSRLVISAVSPNIIGAVQGMGAISTATEPRSAEDLAEMRELRVWDDDAQDFRVFTLALPDMVVFDRLAADLDLKGVIPMSHLTPNPLYDYFWGSSEGDMLVPLQQWREKRMDQLDKLFARQVNPPGFAKGVTGLTDEKYAAAFRKGGVISTGLPNAELTPMYPQLPPESFAEINAIDSMFNSTLGIPPILLGENPEGGAKGESGLSVMVQMASAPIVNQMLEVEAALERAGDVFWRLVRRNDATVLTTDGGEKFACSMLPEGCIVRVAANTSSPLFSADLRNQAAQMLESGLIDGRTFLELTDPPMQDLLLERFKRKETEEQNERKQVEEAMMQAIKAAPPDEKPGLLQTVFEMLMGSRVHAKPKPHRQR